MCLFVSFYGNANLKRYSKQDGSGKMGVMGSFYLIIVVYTQTN